MVGLVDGNSFYASCEQVFNPQLVGKPIVVLSSNDGNIIARSKEARELNIAMGEPYFKLKPLIEKHGVQVFSSNYELYGDISARMMSILSRFAPETEVYSIDECFLAFPDWLPDDLLLQAHLIREKVKQWTGIPVCVGLAETKTLAKVANKLAKKADGILMLREADEIDTVLEQMNIEDLWGIGRQYAKVLKANGIHKALQLKNLPDGWIRKHLTIVGLRLVYELRGIACLPLETVRSAKKGICTSRSFGKTVSLLSELQEAVSTFAATCAEKLRKEKTAAGIVTVFIHTNSFSTIHLQYSNSRSIRLPVATQSTPEIIHYAMAALASIFKDGYQYKKAGVIITHIVPVNAIQQNLFDGVDRAKQETLMGVVDDINQKLGKNTVKYAVQSFPNQHTRWLQSQSKLSPCYTTRWEQVLKAG